MRKKESLVRSVERKSNPDIFIDERPRKQTIRADDDEMVIGAETLEEVKPMKVLPKMPKIQ